VSADRSWKTEKWDSVFWGFKSAGVYTILIRSDPSSLSPIIPVAKKYGIRVEVWFIAMMNNDPELIKEHPGWSWRS